MNRGEVWRVRIDETDGHAQSGERPAVIVQDDKATAALPTLLVVPFSSNQRTTRFAGTLLVAPDGQNGLTVPSVALAFQLRTLDKRALLRPLGILDAVTLDRICDLIERLIGR